MIFAPGHSGRLDQLLPRRRGRAHLHRRRLLGSSTTTVNDLGSYRASLQQLVKLPNLKVICPGHGAIVNDPRERLQGLIAHREMRERQILEVLDDRRPRTSWEIMEAVYPGLDKRLKRAATGNVETHLRQLEQEKRLLLHPGRAKKPNANVVQREVEHAKYVDGVLKEAKKLEEQRRRAELRMQESPPGAAWSRQPKYELVGRAKD
ncbi:MAG: hypothetical protein U0360_10400 [Dehalococcoidia bacterium]